MAKSRSDAEFGDLGPLPQVHPRDILVTTAGLGLQNWSLESDLTYAEEMMVLAQHMRNRMQAAVSSERNKKEANAGR